jgi:hypothetical protein
MVKWSTTLILGHNSTFIKSPWRRVNSNSNRLRHEWILKFIALSFFNIKIGVNNILSLRRIIFASTLKSFIRIFFISFNSLVNYIVKGLIYWSSATTLISVRNRTVYNLLIRKYFCLRPLKNIYWLKISIRSKRIARATLTFVGKVC